MRKKINSMKQKLKEKLGVKRVLEGLSRMKARGRARLAAETQKSPLKMIQARRLQAKQEVRVSPSAELAVEKAKFFTGTEMQPQSQVTCVAPRPLPEDLPSRYGQDRLVLQTRDPWWIHAYWEVSPHTEERLVRQWGDDYHHSTRVLRVYDVSFIQFDGTNAHRWFDISISGHANNWYIDVGGPGRSWCVDLGMVLPDGKFITILRSNTVSTPLDGPSWVTDEEWMIPEEIFAKLYGLGLGAGVGTSSPVGKAWRERLAGAFSGAMASPGMASMASPVKKEMAKRKGFWLVVNTELIVYGATEPDATVTIQDKPVTLRPDGTFSARFALPDGKQVIPVKAVSSDRTDERVITPIVTRETR